MKLRIMSDWTLCAPHRGCGWGKVCVVLALLGGFQLAGCRPEAAAAKSEAEATVEFDPSPPVIGTVGLKIQLRDAAGEPVSLGELEVEGNMNHAGMKPVFTTLKESEPGSYAGTIEFTMGGDWFLLLTGQRPGGGLLEMKVDVPGVNAK